VLDDWVLLGFLVGNDFIPHLPDLHIHTDSLPYLWRTYCDTLPTLGGYINDNGHLNLARFEKFLRKLSQFDMNNFSEKMCDMKYMAGKKGGGGPKRAPRNNASLGTQATGILTANQFFALRNDNGGEGGLQGMFGDDDGGDTNDDDLMTSDSGVAALASGVLGTY
jgi:5'-3' exonuclease